ncbi:hypothetical protein IMCC14465_03360 [alpha proteobacterium IMCC14465]|uniref:CDP-diacylglycerol--glycerol-3-phosphate 3-phosphatidyltransferase n=1 Tax=alpha proteobacterium IMCC14465 TaxID=1220535 RepID=J9DY26_9PROT|nr:hypothetical protein IMCC14465_03360 [alpha proteobacterium IMCC14465]
MKRLPNLLTLFRVLMIPALVLVYLIPGPLGNWFAFSIYTLAAITDYLDGWLARKLKATSEFGRMLDPIADKLMVVAVLIILIEFRDISGIHTLAAGLIIMREILISWFREYLTDRGVTLAVSQIAKYKTTIQMIALGVLLLGEAGDMISPFVKDSGLVLLWVATLFTIWTAIDYLSKGTAALKMKK